MGQSAKRVLVVDDDASVRRLAGYLLGAAGFEVATARDGQEALAAVTMERPDVIVLDLNMPVMDGYTFVREMGTEGHPQILILSAQEAEKARRELGVDASLRKPFRPDDLVQKVEALSSSSAD